MVVVLSLGKRVMRHLNCRIPLFPSILCCSFLTLLTFILFSLKQGLTLIVVCDSRSVQTMTPNGCFGGRGEVRLVDGCCVRVWEESHETPVQLPPSLS